MKKWAWFKREEPQQGNLFSPNPGAQQIRPVTPPARPSAPPAPSTPPSTPAAASQSITDAPPPPAPPTSVTSEPPSPPRSPASNAPPVSRTTTSAPPVPLPSPSGAPKLERVIFTVGELTRDIKATLERGYARIWVRGEVSGFRGPNARGHLYFSLKDADACLDAKMWASAAQRLKFSLRDGLSVIAEGSIDLYEPQGRYSLIVQRIEPEGEGALALAFQQLKERLAAEGLLGDNRKRPPRTIPFLPRRIGVVTSLHGAAIRDFLRVLHHRHPRLSVLVCDAR
ncbi:MAG TPA: exodeoxyribonuclease VII large subunit, partial [Myxococcaceae bacterium]|nr:exodeoxyribonuclease VII large subunit [Myxococcaceae bacterium]